MDDGADIQDGGLKFECPASGDALVELFLFLLVPSSTWKQDIGQYLVLVDKQIGPYDQVEEDIQSLELECGLLIIEVLLEPFRKMMKVQ